MKTKKELTFGHLPKDYQSLCQIYLPRVIHHQEGYGAAEEVCDTMAGFEDTFTNDQSDYFELITDLMWEYEQTQMGEAPKLSLPARLESLLESADWNASDLGRFLGLDATMGNKILRGERRLTVEHIEKLTKRFSVKAEYFWSESRMELQEA